MNIRLLFLSLLMVSTLHCAEGGRLETSGTHVKDTLRALDAGTMNLATALKDLDGLNFKKESYKIVPFFTWTMKQNEDESNPRALVDRFELLIGCFSTTKGKRLSILKKEERDNVKKLLQAGTKKRRYRDAVEILCQQYPKFKELLADEDWGSNSLQNIMPRDTPHLRKRS